MSHAYAIFEVDLNRVGAEEVRSEWRENGGWPSADQGAFWEESRPLPAGDLVERVVDRKDEIAGFEDAAEEARRELGAALFRAAMPLGVRAYLRDSLNKRSTAGTRTRLWLGFSDSTLETYPWELMFDEGVGGYLVLQPGLSVVRKGDVQAGSVVPGFAGSPKIYFVDTSNVKPIAEDDILLSNLPGGYRDKVLPDATAVVDGTPSFPARVSWPILHDFMVDRAKADSTAGNPVGNIFCFVGHGLAADDKYPPSLVFSSVDPGVRRVEATLVGACLGEVGVDLALLIACDAGRGANWAGLGAALLGHVPTIVSMQAPLEHNAAIVFAKELFDRLCAGVDVDAAVGAARLCVHAKDHLLQDWWLAMVHSRAAPLSFEPITTMTEDAAIAGSASQDTPQNGAAALLIVDDEDADELVQLLPGYQHLIARDLPGAIRLVESDERIDLAIVDMMLGEKTATSGRAILDFLNECRPEVPKIVVSSDPRIDEHEQVVEHFQTRWAVSRLLFKPRNGSPLTMLPSVVSSELRKPAVAIVRAQLARRVERLRRLARSRHAEETLTWLDQLLRTTEERLDHLASSPGVSNEELWDVYRDLDGMVQEREEMLASSG